MIRYDGTVVPGNPHHVPPTPSDPRTYRNISGNSALWRRLEPMELTVPRLKVGRMAMEYQFREMF